MTVDRLATARTTVGMALAANRGDMHTALTAWASASDQERAVILAQLIELPGLILQATGRGPDYLQEIAYRLATQGTHDDD